MCVWWGTLSPASAPSLRSRRRAAHAAPSSSTRPPRCVRAGSNVRRCSRALRVVVAGMHRGRIRTARASRRPVSLRYSAPRTSPALWPPPSWRLWKLGGFSSTHACHGGHYSRCGDGGRRAGGRLVLPTPKPASRRVDHARVSRGGPTGMEGRVPARAYAASGDRWPGALLRPGYRLRVGDVCRGYRGVHPRQDHTRRCGPAGMAIDLVGAAQAASTHDAYVDPARHGTDCADRVP